MCDCNCAQRFTDLEAKIAQIKNLEKVEFTLKGSDLVAVIKKSDKGAGR